MKLNRVENSRQNVTSATARKRSSAIAAHSASQPSATKTGDRRQRSGSNADTRSHGAAVNAIVATSNHRPNARTREILSPPAFAKPVSIHSEARSSAHTTSAADAARRIRETLRRFPGNDVFIE